VLDNQRAYSFPAQVEAWAYGTERECPECPMCGETNYRIGGPDAPVPCLDPWHGTGKVREAGLVERVEARARELASAWVIEHPHDPVTLDAFCLMALRAELGAPDG